MKRKLGKGLKVYGKPKRDYKGKAKKAGMGFLKLAKAATTKAMDYEKKTRSSRKQLMKKAAKRVKKAGAYKAPPVSFGGGRV